MQRDPEKRRKLSARDIWALIAATYRASFPYLLLVIAVMVLLTWFITVVVF